MTHAALHIPHTNRSFPSFIQPAFAAATASIDDGFVEYVDNLNVDNRDKNEVVDDGLYSTVAGCGVGALALALTIAARVSSSRCASFSLLA